MKLQLINFVCFRAGADSSFQKNEREDRMAKKRDFSIRQKILLAAATLLDETDIFSIEDLVVRCWQLYPEAFALRGYESKYPDSNRVQCKLAGTDGLCGLGWIEHAETQRMYRVTRKGRDIAKRLWGGVLPTVVEEVVESAPPPRPRMVPISLPKSEAPLSPAPKPKRPHRRTVPEAIHVAPLPAPVKPLSEEDVLAINLLAKCEALRKFLRASPFVFADACLFWGITPQTKPSLVQGLLDATDALCRRVVDSFPPDGPTRTDVPSSSTCYGLLNLHRLMIGRFTRELDALREAARRTPFPS